MANLTPKQPRVIAPQSLQKFWTWLKTIADRLPLLEANGASQVNIKNDGLAIAKGEIAGHSFIHKFGNAPDFDSTDGDITMWDGAEDGTAWENMVYDYSATADIDSVSSEDAGDTVDLEVQGLDADYNVVVQTVTLNGQTRVALTTNLIRIFRSKNVGATDLVGHVFVYVNGAITGGIPDDASTIRAVVHPENNQTEMAVFTIPANRKGYLCCLFASTAGASKATSYVIRLKARPFGQVFQLKHKGAIADDGTSHFAHVFNEPEVFAAKTDIEITIEIADGAKTAAAVAGGFDIVLVEDGY